MAYPIPAEVLKHVRDAAKLSQAALAKQMDTVPSVLSKLERAEDIDPEMAERYLTAIGSDLSRTVLDFYARPWLRDRPPSFLHPDAETLWVIDQALRELADFETETNDPILRGPITRLRDELNTVQTYLNRSDHIVAWVGDIGVGKTTALTYAAGLLVGDGRSGRRPAFPVGPGRTTVCETAIRAATTFGVLVDPKDDEAVLRLARELVSSLAPDAAGVGVSTEQERVLRGMADMNAQPDVVDDEPVLVDPIVNLLASGLGVDEVTDRLVAEMKLSERRERQLILPEGSEDGLDWVSRLVSNINSGLDKRFSFPERITVLMPSSNLKADGQTLSVIDTRGIENMTQRGDLIALDENSRALMVLCTKFADAPNATVQRLLQDGIDAESIASDRRRKCILVLPRGDEALELVGAEKPNARQLGYAFRRKDVDQALVKAGLPKTPVYFFDARNDEPDKIWALLRKQIGEMRAVFADRGRAAAEGVRNLSDNIDDVRVSEARREIETEVDRVLKLARELSESVRPAYQNLLDQMAVGHHSSIAASIFRQGDWEPFHFAQILGQGVRMDASRRTSKLAARIEHKLDELTEKWGGLVTIMEDLNGLRARLVDGRQEFLSAARVIGRDAYSALLAGNSEIWKVSGRRYGLGSGYKRDVADLWRKRFTDEDDAAETASKVGLRLQDAWDSLVLQPLREATRAEPSD